MQANTQQVLRGEDEQTEAYTAPRCGQGRKSPRAAPRPSEGPDLPLRPWQLVPPTTAPCPRGHEVLLPVLSLLFSPHPGHGKTLNFRTVTGEEKGKSSALGRGPRPSPSPGPSPRPPAPSLSVGAAPTEGPGGPQSGCAASALWTLTCSTSLRSSDS